MSCCNMIDRENEYPGVTCRPVAGSALLWGKYVSEGVLSLWCSSCRIASTVRKEGCSEPLVLGQHLEAPSKIELHKPGNLHIGNHRTSSVVRYMQFPCR
jgi:hypothetical protein